MSEPSIREIAEGVKIHLENLAKANPGLKINPYFIIAMDQLNDVIKRLKE